MAAPWLPTAMALAATILLAAPSASQRTIASRLAELDGSIGDPEWRDATRHALPEGEIFVRREGGLLVFGIRTEPLYVASLCLATNERVVVLHASAALGAVSYTPSAGGWTSNEEFDWRMRDPSMAPAAIAARHEYFSQNRWVATTMGMGEPGTVEFLVDESALAGDHLGVALGLMTERDPERIVGWPAERAGDCADHALVGGPAPRALNFQPDHWVQLRGEPQE